MGRRRRVQVLLADLFSSLGTEVFLLCTLAASITDLSRVDQHGLLPRVGEWWNNVSHPAGLTAVAGESCDSTSIRSAIDRIRETSETGTRMQPAGETGRNVLQNDGLAEPSSCKQSTQKALNTMSQEM